MCMGFPGGAAVKNPPANAGGARDVGSIPGLGRYTHTLYHLLNLTSFTQHSAFEIQPSCCDDQSFVSCTDE